MLLAYAAVIMPHIQRLPIWITLVAICTLVWRIQVYLGRWRFPPRWLKYLFAGISGTALLLNYGKIAGLEPMVGLLVVAYSLKLLEMYQRRDALAVIFLAFIVASTQFLFEQTMVATILVGVQVLFISTALLGLNQSAGHKRPLGSAKLACQLLGLSIPLMLVLFIIIPRIGSLWAVPLLQTSAKTGVSDSMAPGDFSNLGKSGELAFRVTFEGDIPPQNTLYWRGLVLSRFDGRTWTTGALRDYFRDGPFESWYQRPPRKWESLIERNGGLVNYEVTLEPSNQTWLYALGTPVALADRIALTRDFRLISQIPIQKRFTYPAKSYLDHRIEPDFLPGWRRENETELPLNYNPRTLALSKTWLREGLSQQAIVQRALDWFNREFEYTLNPPLLGRHTADEFLFDTKQGFCEHFASAFVILMRAAGIPARVVTGYQGGEINPLENYLLVHQFDAHAWAEVWTQGQGWVRVDPTFAVAPERIRNSGQEIFSQQSEFLANSPFSLLRFGNISALYWLRMRLDLLDYSWHRWVLGYDKTMQFELLTRLLGRVDPWRIAVIFIGACTAVLGALAFYLFVRRGDVPQSPEVRQYQRFCRKLAKLGFRRSAGEASGSFALRVATGRPDLQAAVAAITLLFERISYSREAVLQKQLKQAVDTFKPARKQENQVA